MTNLFKKLSLSESGATAVEYGLIVALIALSALIAISGVAKSTTNMWSDVASEVTLVS
ncbi:Flp family type IVb pilin [Parasphingorhabdus sp.]|jgi:pilus assembly protein Flp/PilA|uniref:Flp family type IVb pilin n=1 Tax=Parasphingorhabdus sp. TaxID=2709688 RepID=UPI003001681D